MSADKDNADAAPEVSRLFGDEIYKGPASASGAGATERSG